MTNVQGILTLVIGRNSYVQRPLIWLSRLSQQRTQEKTLSRSLMQPIPQGPALNHSRIFQTLLQCLFPLSLLPGLMSYFCVSFCRFFKAAQFGFLHYLSIPELCSGPLESSGPCLTSLPFNPAAGPKLGEM